MSGERIRCGERVYVPFCGLGQVLALCRSGIFPGGWATVLMDFGATRHTESLHRLKAVTIEAGE